MLVVGLLSSENEAKVIKDIAKICELENRIRFIVRTQKIKDLLKKEDKRF
jgi:ribosomal protein L18E